MDGLSVAASIIAVLQAANAVVSVCYDYRAALREAPWALTKVTDEVCGLRAVLESLVATALPTGGEEPTRARLAALELLCMPEGGMLGRCLAELEALQKKLSAPSSSWYGKVGSKRRAAIQAMGWRLKDSDVKKALEHVERFKTTLIMAMNADETTLLAEIHSTMQDVSGSMIDIQEGFASFLESFTSMRLDDRKRAILHWLSPVDSVATHEAVTKAHQDGTCNWFVQSKEFTEWREAEQSFLWLTGFPGAGKTVLSSTAVDFLQRSQSQSDNKGFLAFFYCDFRRQEFQKPGNALGSILATLCLQLGTFPDTIELAYDQSMNVSGQSGPPELSLLAKALTDLGTAHKVTVVIDALDECNERGELLAVLANLGHNMLRTNILITGRNEQDICDAFSGFTRLRLEHRSSQVGDDINLYVTKRLEQDVKLKWLNASIKADIEKALVEKANGMFRWVQCHLDEMASLKTIRAIRHALEELPEGLYQSYENILARTSPANSEIVRRILLWLSFSMIPLTLEHIWDAIAIEKDVPHPDEEGRLSCPQDIVDLCGNFLNVSDDLTSEATLVHLSVKEFLLSPAIRKGKAARFALSPDGANAELAINCLAYLSFDEFRSVGACRSLKAYRDRLERYPLLIEVARAWPYYANAATSAGSGGDDEEELNRRIYAFFSPASRNVFLSWVQALNAQTALAWNYYNANATPLYYAASFGMASTVQRFIDDCSGDGAADLLNAPASRFGGSALHAAVIRRHTGVMEMLMRAGADPNQADWSEISPLHTAAAHGHRDVVTLLLRFGADADAVDRYGLTPYDWAVDAGQAEAQQALLLHRNADSKQAS